MFNKIDKTIIKEICEAENFNTIAIFSTSNRKTTIEYGNINTNLKTTTVNNFRNVIDLEHIKLDLIITDTHIKDIEKIVNYYMSENSVIISKVQIIDNSVEVNKIHIFSKNGKFEAERLEYILDKVDNNKNKNKPIIGVGLLTYNHEPYILECLNGIFKQRGNYNVRLIIIDDCSTDKTYRVITKYLKENSMNNCEITSIRNRKNKGCIPNLKFMFNFFKSTDYFTICEGDDYWTDPNRLTKLCNFMDSHKTLSLVFNDMYILQHNDKKIIESPIHNNLKKKIYNTRELINQFYFIGNLGCCFYDSFFLKNINDDVYELPFYDYFINTLYSQFGYIGHYNQKMSVYRKHDNSIWHDIKYKERNLKLYDYINQYNQYFNYKYDNEYYNNKIEILNASHDSNYIKKDLLIIDNVFPSEVSGFSYIEITEYLKNIESSLCLATGELIGAVDDKKIEDVINNYKVKNREIGNKVCYKNSALLNTVTSKLAYFIFLNTIYVNIEYIEKKKIPFIFELYPGGAMLFDDSKCDNMLRRVMKSKYFKKVIVTQDAIKDYLLKKKFCKESQIENIFGVVMKIDDDVLRYKRKYFYGYNKESLDIVFMAHKYCQYGKDKGYDTFIETAKQICKKNKNIYFHIVGNFTADDIDVSDIKDYIIFHGKLSLNDFNNFFEDKDIIISPNIPNILASGAFDGFPTASVTEASLREVAMFVTDPFGMNNGRFIEKKEIEIIEPNSEFIYKLIEFYYENPYKLKLLSKNGKKKTQELYSYEKQMKPRLSIIKEAIEKEKQK